MKLSTDDNGFQIQIFTPNDSVTYNGVVNTDRLIVIKLGADANISINGKSAKYNEGELIALSKEVTYTFNNSVDCHIMK